MHEFSRTELLTGTEGLEKLRNSTVAVFGTGGVGSHCVLALARSGVGHLHLTDSDRVSLTNINRQAMAFHSTIGKYKTQVLKWLIADICPETEVRTWERFIGPDNLGDILDAGADYIVDAVDNVTAKLALAEEAQKRGIPLISCMGTGNKMHPEQFEIADISETSVCPLCRVMRRELKARGITGLKVVYSREKPLTPLVLPEEKEPQEGKRSVPGSMSFVPPAAGLLLAGEVIRELLEGRSGEDGLI
ncbi:MAG TPA: tRNA threonylcarbamoyladenosine dehydratase [Candidatus Bariatricus faecipullorum]|mgnify:FL=1|nr:tRNA threonylcarbamoyladenosine dehydratase [Candidatus Bariatricus faecipullorum]